MVSYGSQNPLIIVQHRLGTICGPICIGVAKKEIIAAAICHQLALQWGGVTKSWSDPSATGTFVGFSLLLIIFGLVEWYMGDRALLQGALLGRLEILVNIIYVFL